MQEVGFKLNFQNGFKNNYVIDALMVVNRLANRINSKYYVNSDNEANNFIYLIKTSLVFSLTMTNEIHFPYSIYYSLENDEKNKLIIINFSADNTNLSEIVRNKKYKFL